MSALIRCAHISDLHFATPTWGLGQFLSKRWLGNCNHLFSRNWAYDPAKFLHQLTNTLKEKDVTHVFITGDLSSTSSKEEFLKAKEFMEGLQGAGIRAFVLPGNHDKYTKKACESQLFYEFFPEAFSGDSAFTLKKHRLSSCYLGHKWWLVGMDTAHATSLLSSCGTFSQEQELALNELLQSLPEDHHVVLLNHFPFSQQEAPRKLLKRGGALATLLQRHANVRLYLHGHTHRHCVADLGPSSLPVVLDSGSISHKQNSSWNLVDLYDKGATVEAFFWNQKTWDPLSFHSYVWDGS